jgi:hypothetical protein
MTNNNSDDKNLDNKNKVINFNDNFKLPIYYNESKMRLNKNIIDDLELVNTIDENNRPILEYYFNSNNSLSKNILSQMSEYYTTDIKYLKDSQLLLQNYKNIQSDNSIVLSDYKNIVDIWNEIKNDTGFKERYYYVDWPMWEFLNRSEQFLQIMSVFNMTSPIISLLLPIIILIIPFFVIKLKGLSITIEEYLKILKLIISQHALGKLFTEFNNVENQQKMYLLISAGFYLFSFYQNILTCVRFNKNMYKIHNDLKEVEIYLDYTINNIDNFLIYADKLESYNRFCEILKEKKCKLVEFKYKLNRITEYKLSYKKLFEIGNVLKYFYELYDDKIYEDAILYSFGFNAYIDNINGLINNIDNKKINFTQFTNKKKNNVFKNSYYAILKDKEHVKNTIKLNKNIIVTGPNASGKTTLLKSTLINIILTQQFGCGFYDMAKLYPYKYIHCYLNIPDTSGRDSLFQAEARRCKNILDIVDFNKKETHFCAFDELYSGTNPEEAEISATAFMEYLVKNKNISCILTTHFIKVCNKLNKNKHIINCHMDALKENNKIIYGYKLKNGISNLKGGVHILSQMNYPKEILEKTFNS